MESDFKIFVAYAKCKVSLIYPRSRASRPSRWRVLYTLFM